MRRGVAARKVGVREAIFGAAMASRLSRQDPWAVIVQDFLADKRRTCAPGTVETYSGILLGPRTTRWRRDHQIRLPRDVDTRSLGAFQVNLQKAGRKPETVFTYHKVLKTFLRWALAEGQPIDARATTMKGPRRLQTEPQTYTRAELARLIAAARYDRDRVVIEVLTRTGLRVSEMCQLTLSDVVDGPHGSWLRVHGKGGRDRIVPVDTPTHRLSRTLRAYIRDIRPDCACDALFVTPPVRRPGANYRPLTPNAVKILLRHLWQQTGIHIHAHGLRHTWTTDSLRAGVDIEALRRAGGWSSYRMIQRYSHYTTADLVDAWQRRRD